jgi:DNA-binding transcriptional LysR family regulator
MTWRESAEPALAENVQREGSDYFFDFFIMAIRAAVAGLGIALLPRVLIEQELAARQLIRVGEYTATNVQKTYLLFPQQKRDWGPLIAFAAWLDAEMEHYRSLRIYPEHGGRVCETL